MTLFGLFVLFLVLSKTLNSVGSQLLKIEFMLQKECEFKKEEQEIQHMIAENLSEQRRDADDEEEDD